MILVDPHARPVIAHRGESAHAPENTMPAFERAVALGAEALEFDVRLTADGHAVVHHDPSVERTTGGSGLVREHTLARLQALDAGARFVTRGGVAGTFADRGVRVPTLDEVLGAWPDVPVLVEIKVAEASDAVRACLDRHGAARRAVVASFVDAAVAPFRESGYATGASQRDAARLLAAALAGVRARGTYRLASLPPTYNGIRLPLGRMARALAGSGIPLHVWTVDDPAVAHALWAVGVTGMVSNDPARILAARDGSAAGGVVRPASS